MFDTGPVYLANLNAPEKVLVNQGGTSSTKTYSIVQLLYWYGITRPGSVITVTGESIPNLKRGAYRDAENIFARTPALKSYVSNWNQTERIIRFHSGSLMEFTSYESEQGAKNGKRDILFVNEANGLPYNIYWQLARRTRFKVLLDYNPSAKFWAHEKVIGKANTKLIISDHRHNLWLSEQEHADIESIKDEDEELWKVYARGLTGKIEGLVFRKVFDVPSLPEGAKYIGAGLDFGFTNDPTTTIDVYKSGGELYCDEMMWEAGLTNSAINTQLISLKPARAWDIVADSAEPKSIKELQNLGLPVEPAQKGADSVMAGIQAMQQYTINLLPSCKNLKKEFGAYKWKVDRLTGEPTNEPIDKFNHGIDAVRYLVQARLQAPEMPATRAKVRQLTGTRPRRLVGERS
jgi:phage terminase large subunit